jgi:hypothetical protein
MHDAKTAYKLSYSHLRATVSRKHAPELAAAVLVSPSWDAAVTALQHRFNAIDPLVARHPGRVVRCAYQRKAAPVWLSALLGVHGLAQQDSMDSRATAQ